MSKETAYQKLKRQNNELKNKLYKLVTEPESEEAILIKAEIVLGAGIEKAIFYGDPNGEYVPNGIKKKDPHA